MKVAAAFALAAALVLAPAFAATPADALIVEKAARRLMVVKDGVVTATYRIRLGQDPIGHKQRQGDSRTPEGRYVIDRRNAQSSYHLSLGISYPDADDRAAARAAGVDPGGDIFIHGFPNGWDFFLPLHWAYDWTDGCIAVSNGAIETLWDEVPVGTPIEIRP